MSVIIRLQNLPLTANSIDIRNFFRGLSIPDGGVHIVGGSEGDAFIAFSTDEDARQAMQLTGQKLKDSPVKLLLSSRNEMFKVIEQARLQALGLHPQGSPSSLQGGENSTSSQSSSASSNALQTNASSGMPPLRSPDPTNSNQTNPMIMNSGPNSALPLPTGQSVGNMQNFPVPNMNLPTGNVPNHFMPQGIMASFPGIPTGPPPQQQHQQFPNIPPNSQGMFNNRAPNPSVNPFIIPPNMPSMGNPMGFPGMMPNSIPSGSSNSPGNIGGGMGNQAGMNSSNGILGMPGMMNQQGPTPGGMPGAFNVGGPRMGTMNNPMGMNNNNGMNGPGGTGNNNFMGMGPNNFPPFMGGSGGNNNKPGAPSGGMGPGSRPPRPNFNPHNQQHQHRPTGPMNNNMSHNNSPRERNLGLNAVSGGGLTGHNRENDIGNANQHRENRDSRDLKGGRRSRSRSRERRERENTAARRRRSRSRSRDRDVDVRGDRSRDKDRDRRRRRSRSKSRSRSRDRGGRVLRRTSRDREKGRDERRKSESSPEKSTDKSGSIKRGQDIEKRGRRDSDPLSNCNNITDEEHPCIKLIGLPKDASFREIREFVRVEIQGGGEGVVRHFDEGLAFLKLERASDFPKVYRSNGRKLRNSVINIEGISFDKWTQEYKSLKKEGSRDRERDADRDRDRERDFRDRDRHNDRDKNSNQRTSRFNNNASSMQSNCIAIRGLPPAITGKDVSSRLLRDAPVTDLLVVPAQGTNGRLSVTAFVSLENPTAAQRAVDNIVRSQEGASLIVELCELEDMNQARRNAPGGQSRDRDNRQSGSGAKSLFDLDVGMDVESSSVMLQGVPPNISDRDVFDFFSDIGLKPTNVRKLFDSIGSPSGQVICEFQDNHKALRATTKDGMMFGRNSISVTLIPSGGSSVNSLDFRNPHGGMSRPSLLGVRPNGPGNASQNPRFHNPNPNPNPNPFVQAMQQSMVPNITPGPGMRPNGPTRGMRNPSSNRMSRFDSRGNNNMDYEDFRDGGSGNRNGVDRDDRVSSATRGRGHNMSSNDLGMTPEKIHLFKPGCIVALTNVPFKAEIEDIAKFLEDVLKIQIPYDRIVRNLNDMGKSTGNARVAFQTSFEAELANDRLRGSTMWNRPIITEVLAEIVWS